MLVVNHEEATASLTPSIKTSEVKKREPVTGHKFWKVTYQLGPNVGFGKAFPSNRWKKRADQLPGETPIYDPVYTVYEQILTTDEANGLVSKNNAWQAANTRQKVGGEVGKMLVILDIQEAKDYEPKNVTFLHGGMPMQVLKMLVESAVDSRLKNSK